MADNENFYLIGVFIVVILSVAFMAFMNDASADRTIDEPSSEYVERFSLGLNESGIDSFADQDVSSDGIQNPLLNTIGNIPGIGDVLGGIFFFVEKTQIVWNFLRLAFNVPTFLMTSIFGKWIGAFSTVINIIGLLIEVTLILIIVRIVK